VPLDIAPRVGWSHFCTSLRTSEPSRARQRAARCGMRAHLLWSLIRDKTVMTKEEIDALVHQWFWKVLESDRDSRLEAWPSSVLASWNEELRLLHDEPVRWQQHEFETFEAESELEEWTDELKSRQWHQAAELADELLREHVLNLPRDSRA